MIKTKLVISGYAHYKPSITYRDTDVNSIENEFRMLEIDRYAPEKVNRFRRYGNGIIIPWESIPQVHWIPPITNADGIVLTGYDQGGNNPEHENIRYFNSLSDHAKDSDLLRNLILDDFSHTFWNNKSQEFPIYFGTHFVKLQSHAPYDAGISSPNCFHQDGEPFTFGHLVYRSSNTDGGINYIGRVSARDKSLTEVSEDEIVEEFTLHQFLETFAVFDPVVSHYVNPIYKASGSIEVAERWMILIDFSTTRQNI
jgi:2OG-Fe dioxygenase